MEEHLLRKATFYTASGTSSTLTPDAPGGPGLPAQSAAPAPLASSIPRAFAKASAGSAVQSNSPEPKQKKRKADDVDEDGQLDLAVDRP